MADKKAAQAKPVGKEAIAKAKAERDKAKVPEKGKAQADPKKAATTAKEAKPPKVKKEKPAPEPKEPAWVTQLDEHGNEETVDMNKFPIPIQCCVDGCDQVRYTTASGALNVTMCKPHARKFRRKRRVLVKRDQAKKYKAIIADALKFGLFPDKFKKKHGLE